MSIMVVCNMGKQNKRLTFTKTDVNKKLVISEKVKDDKVIWRFHRLDKDGKFAFDTNRQDFNYKLLLEKLLAYSTMTWQEIQQATHDKGKSKNHLIRNAQEEISKEAWQRIEVMHLEDDSDSLYSFALTNIERVWGLKIGNEFHVLWYDPKHEVFPSKRK